MFWLMLSNFFSSLQTNAWNSMGLSNHVSNAHTNIQTIRDLGVHQEILSNIYFFIPKTEIVIWFTIFMLFIFLRIILALIKWIKD